MRVVVVTTSYPIHAGDFRGRFVHDLASALTHRGHSVTVVTPHPGFELPARDVMEEVTVRRVLAGGPASGPTVFGCFGVMEALQERPFRAIGVARAMGVLGSALLGECRDADLVVSNWLVPSGLLAAAISKRQGIPHLAIEHGGGMRLLAGLPRPASGRLLRFIAAHSVVIHFVSRHQQEMAQEILGRSPEGDPRFVVAPMPIPSRCDRVGTNDGKGISELRAQTSDHRPPTTNHPAPLRAVYAGRLTAGKGVELAIEALRMVPDCRLDILGHGPLRRSLTEKVRRLGLSHRICFQGLRPHYELPLFLAVHDVLLMPSAPTEGGLEEGMPRILLEAMDAGVVPVVSNAGSMAQTVRHDVSGLVFDVASPEAIADCLARLRDEPGLLQRLSTGAISQASGHTFEALFETWAEELPGL